MHLCLALVAQTGFKSRDALSEGPFVTLPTTMGWISSWHSIMAIDTGADMKHGSTIETKLTGLNFVVCLERSTLLNSRPFCLEFCTPWTHPASPWASIFMHLPPGNPGAQIVAYDLLVSIFLSQHPAAQTQCREHGIYSVNSCEINEWVPSKAPFGPNVLNLVSVWLASSLQ